MLKNAQTTELFSYTEADQRLDALNALDPRNVGGLNTQGQLAKDQNLQACRGATNCIDDVNRRYDRQVSDRAEAVLTTINAINAYSQCAAGDVSCVSGSLVQMKAVQSDLKARGVKLEESERIGLNSYIASAEATLGNGFEALSAAAMGAAGIKGSEAGNAGGTGATVAGVNVPKVGASTVPPRKTITVDSNGNALIGDWSQTRALTSPENAQTHWTKHGSEFPEFSKANQYVEAAQNFVSNPPAGVLIKTSQTEIHCFTMYRVIPLLCRTDWESLEPCSGQLIKFHIGIGNNNE